MSFDKIYLNTRAPEQPQRHILMIYTGGTLGMSYNKDRALVPFDFHNILEQLPFIKNMEIGLTVISLKELIDSSNIDPQHWRLMTDIIVDHYEKFDGFVILHGTDTMAYSASALSFMLQGLNKPVIFTGAQLPISAPRSDARENLITALEIASAYEQETPVVSEVCIYFDYFLLRGNRSKKVESIHFDAFESENYPVLAEAGISIDYRSAALKPYDPQAKLEYFPEMDNRVGVLKLFPGINEAMVKQILSTPNLKGVILESYGSGNAPSDTWFVNCLKNAIDNNVLIFNVSQCNGGRVLQGRYETSKTLDKIGVLSGADITFEAAVTKMMHLLGKENSSDMLGKELIRPISGEMV